MSELNEEIKDIMKEILREQKIQNKFIYCILDEIKEIKTKLK
jgi:hypothetical protein